MPGTALSFEQRAHRRAFGENVGRIRRDRGWTQEDLAERAELHRSYLASIETGVRNPSLDVIVRLAKGLRVPVAELFA
ncbi:helix-turn-helix domain-containing protein [Nocardioides rubriscoriae]|uniref:helix-turn-helix domain-containing protein n=1 Tax=Nocardioides rubriscoriae TaxID=642762 RepID=UPI0011DF7A3D